MRITTAKTLFFFCLLLMPCALRAQNTEEQRDAAQCEEFFERGQEHLYNNAYELADHEFNLFIECAPTDPRGDLRRIANLFFWKRHEQKKDELKVDEVAYAQYIAFIDQGIVKAEIKRSSNENVEFYTYVKAYFISLRSALEYANGKGWAALNSAQELSALCKESTYQDSKFLLGFLGYLIDRRGFFARRGASFFGLPNNKKEGFELIRQAVEGNNNPFADDIWFLMLQILTDEKASEKDRNIARAIFGYSAQDIYERLKKYPNNEQVIRLKKRLERDSQ